MPSARCLVVTAKFTAVSQQCPHDACVLVRERDSRDVRVSSLQQVVQPAALAFFAPGRLHDRTCAMDEQRPQIGITALI